MKRDVTRRDFFGVAAGAAGVAAVGRMASAGASTLSENAAAILDAGRDLKIGMFTAPFFNESLEELADFAADAGIKFMEVAAHPGSRQIDPLKLDEERAEAIKSMMAERQIEITALSWFDDLVDPEHAEERQAQALKLIDAAAMLGVGVVSFAPGWPAPRMNKINTIRRVLPGVFGPLIARADEKNVRIAVENFHETCLQGIDTFECLFETIDDRNFGLNYDPAHLYHQQCDYLLPISMFGRRIFHVHAKDCLVDDAIRAHVGIYGPGWWRYALPGFGNIDWGLFASHLRANRYRGVMSIEHEDYTLGRERGFIMSARYLEKFC